MRSKLFSRRVLIGSGTVLIGSGMFAKRATAQAIATLQAALQSAVSLFQPTIAALVQNGIAQLTQTASRLAKLGLSPELLSALLNLLPGIQAGGGVKQKGLVRRVRNPAMIKNPNNPHFLPQGAQFSASEQQAYAPRLAQGGGL